MNNTHHDITDRLSDYIDGELGAARIAARSTRISRVRRLPARRDELRAIAAHAASLADHAARRTISGTASQRGSPRRAPDGSRRFAQRARAASRSRCRSSPPRASR